MALQTWNFNYTGSIQSILLQPGVYLLQAWGAQGGSGNDIIGGKGGYSEGQILLLTETRLFIVVGGMGNWSTGLRAEGGYNGGGFSHTSTIGTGSGSGGGATHIATKDGILSLLKNNINDILIVAGAGGGGCGGNAGNQTGGYGGGLHGENGHNNGYTQCSGGTQSSPGNVGNLQNHTEILYADFGLGGGAHGSGNTWYGGGGGAGLYGGGYGGTHCSGGGGSGYTNPEMIDTKTIAGNLPFVSPGGDQEIGHTGNGFAKISSLVAFQQRKNSNFYKNVKEQNVFDFTCIGE